MVAVMDVGPVELSLEQKSTLHTYVIDFIVFRYEVYKVS